MRLKEPSTNISEHQFGDAVEDKLDSLLQGGRWFTILNGDSEQLFEILERELVHRVN